MCSLLLISVTQENIFKKSPFDAYSPTLLITLQKKFEENNETKSFTDY
jgi:hypothetical protein